MVLLKCDLNILDGGSFSPGGSDSRKEIKKLYCVNYLPTHTSRYDYFTNDENCPPLNSCE